MIHNDWFLRKVLEEPAEYLAPGWRAFAWVEVAVGGVGVLLYALKILTPWAPFVHPILGIVGLVLGGPFMLLPGILTLRKRRLWPQFMPLTVIVLAGLATLSGR
jgi:hypothetical protein